MNYESRTPCASCPYRKDAPRGRWHRSEYENLLRQDGNEMRGALFGCHETRKLPVDEQRNCIGWLLDQRRRNYPSIALRMQLIVHPEFANQATEAHDGGAELYPSIEAMCRANGVRVASRNR